ncbi:lysophospholipid acyltransferase family protein [Pontibacter sp. SGAir0037]|uniref:lysophospholipid acyltransferase family protein n=1 Tax=Pontibacter sp. SGAir0037 TaxID=2571030 RepID=UPI0010CD4B1E|nr:lysophospholipid acyltransferase family protein [Pontibacter sp. SGAir0037]QCR24240.1 glycerol acyltransferase [Pontibacter sp. SGAir0037]
MLYFILKLIFKTGLWIFFRKFEVRNRTALQAQGPLLVVSNHPNTFMDPLIIASLLRQQVYFIAKSTVFNSPFKKWLLHRMHLIPIHRKEDAPAQSVGNDDAFAASYNALEAGKTILIFPEGNSFNERRLRKLKTGTARIALGAQAAASSDVRVRILPIGLNYSAPTNFRSNVFVNVGTPIDVTDYLTSYSQNTSATVHLLTEQMKVELEKLIIVTPTNEEDKLIRQIESIYKRTFAAEVPAAPTEHEQDFLLTRAITKSLAYFKQAAPERVEALKQQIEAYMLQLRQLNLHDAALSKNTKTVVWQSILAMLYLVAGLPVYLYGLLHNYLPYIIPSRVAYMLAREEEWHAPMMLSVGIFTFPIFYTILAILCYQLYPSLPILFLYLLSLPITGFFTLHYWKILRHAKSNWIMLRLFSKRKELVEQLVHKRSSIIQQLEQAKQEILLKQQ